MDKDNEILEYLKRLDQGQKRFEAKMDDSLNKMDQRLNSMEAKMDEHTLILRALEHSSQVNKAEHDKMSNDIAKIQGDIAGIKKDLSQVELVTANNWADIVKLKAVR